MGNNKMSKTVPLSEAITLQRGFDLPKPQRKLGKYPVVTSTGMTTTHNEFKVKAPGVVIGRSGTIGGGQYITEDFWPLNTTLWVKDFKGNNRMFIYYLLRSIDFSTFNAGAAVPTLNRNHLSALNVFFPDLEKQGEIADVLGTLDKKIELNRKMNETLEQMGQALFKHYFITNPTAKEWKEGYLNTQVNIRYGKNLPTTMLQKEGYPVYGGNGKIGYFDKYIYESPMVMIACRGAASGKVNISEPKSFITNNSLALEIKDTSHFTFEYLRFYSFSRKGGYHQFVTGSAQPQVTVDSLSKCKLSIPPQDLITDFTQHAHNYVSKIYNNEEQIKTLATLRDTLLPRLISGKVKA